MTGFEPATTCAQGRCATRLRYTQVNAVKSFSRSRAVNPAPHR